MAIAITNLGSSAAPDYENNVDATSYANASWTPPTADNSIILLWAYNTKATDLGSAGTVSGNGLTWTQQATVGTDPGAQAHRLTCYAAISTGTATAGATTVDFGGVTQSSIIMEFQQVTGVDLTGGLAGAIIQQPTNSGNGITSLAVTLSAANDADNRFAVGIGHGQPEGITFEAGWDELDDINGTSPGHQLASAWDSDSVADVSPSASWITSGAGLGIALEIVAAPEITQTYEESVSISKINAITDGNSITMNTTISLAKVVTTSFLDGFSALVLKGYLSVADFLSSVAAAISFKAGSTVPSDFASSDTETTSFKSSNVNSSDSAASDVEAEEL